MSTEKHKIQDIPGIFQWGGRAIYTANLGGGR